MSELKRILDPGGKTPLAAERERNRSPLASSLRRQQRRHKRRRRRRIALAVLPTLLTLGNGVCGLAAIAVAVSVLLPWAPETKLMVAGILIFGGMLFDALDGSAARMAGKESQFGAELDSLCDAVTFGVAPAVIVWRIGDVQALPLKLTWAVGVLFALSVLIRLARFNVETSEGDPHDSFDGLPSPAAAGTIAAFAISMPEVALFATDPAYPETVRRITAVVLSGSQYFMATLALALAYLMVSRFQYPHVFQQWLRGRRAPHQIGQAMFLVLGALVVHWVMLPAAFCWFAFATPIKTLIRGRHLRQPFRDSA